MSTLEINQALVSGLISLNLGLPIAYENAQFDPVNNAPFLDVVNIPNERVSLSKRELDEETGVFQITYFQPSDTGTYDGLRTIDRILKAFVHNAAFLFGSQRVVVINSGRDAGENVNGWWRSIVSVSYKSDVLRIEDMATPTQILFGTSFSTQQPPGIDTPLQVEYGAAVGTNADPAQLLATGELQINVTGTYTIIALYQFVRATSSGESLTFLRGLINGIQVGNPVAIREDDDNSTTAQQLQLTFAANGGDVFTTEIYNDSALANNDMQLRPETSAIGWGQSPSASLRVLNYV